MKVIFWIVYSFSAVASFESIQMLVTDHKMTWHTADEICTEEFQGAGYRHLAADIPTKSQDYNLRRIEEFESVWLDALIYDLGCRGEVCSRVIERHRRFLTHDFHHFCQNGTDKISIRKHCRTDRISNITSPYMIGQLRDIPRFAEGEEFIVNEIALKKSTYFQCEMARKLNGGKFRRMFVRCNEFHKALCEHYTRDSKMVTTIQYKEEEKGYRTVFVSNSNYPRDMYSKDEENDSAGLQKIIWTSLSVAVAVMSLLLCVGCFVYCKRKNIHMNSVYDTIFMRPRGRNAYTLRVPNDPSSPLSEQTSHPIPSAPPIVRNPAAPPRVDSVQTLASTSSIASGSTSSSYVQDVRYYRNFSYETQPSVAPSQAPRIEIQPSTPSTSGRQYCSSCRRHRKRRDFHRTSSNCTSCFSQYTQPTSRLAHRNISLDTNDTNSLRSQRSSKDTISSRSHTSHHFRRNNRNGLSSKSNSKSEMDYSGAGQIESLAVPAESQQETRGSNPVLRKHRLVDRIESSSGFKLVKRMFSVDLK
ncbi:uncharacterized protein LOC125674144 [Ostrea edulis]|uniref:uncharacterized protein LOC125674144 n=1 Tax=Ostrea edulis TaxID=37623 RepID=UPI0024AF0CFF|nr:uncharacterized protein LOC125674144 [Ostrea edulis]